MNKNIEKRNQTIESFRAKTTDLTTEEREGLLLVRFTNQKGKPCIYVWSGKAAKPDHAYFFDNVTRLEAWVENTLIPGQVYRNEERQKYLAVGAAKAAEFQPDRIIVSTWGYEQTNVQFYLIVGRKGDMLTLQEVGKRKEYTGDMSGHAYVDRSVVIGEPFRRKVTKWGSVNIESYKGATLHDEKDFVGFSEWN